MADFLDAKRDELRARLAELAPLVAEHDRLRRALEALDAVDGSSTTAPAPVPTPTAPAKGERGKGRPQRTERPRPRAVPPPEPAARDEQGPSAAPDPAAAAPRPTPPRGPAPAPRAAATPTPAADPTPVPAADAAPKPDPAAPPTAEEPTPVDAIPPVGAASNGSSFDEDWDAPAPVGRPIVVDPPDEDERDAAMRVVREEPGLPATEIARRIGLPPHDAYRILPGLEEAGLAEKRGRGWHPTGA